MRKFLNFLFLIEGNYFHYEVNTACNKMITTEEIFAIYTFANLTVPEENISIDLKLIKLQSSKSSP